MQHVLIASTGINDDQAPRARNEDKVAAPPKRGRLIPLKTKLETQTSNRTVDVHIVEIPAKSANAVLGYVFSPVGIYVC